jgi:hypothetical protein
MNKLLISLMLIGIAIFSSCKKCMECQTTSKNTGAVVDSYPEICGKKATLNTQELTYRINLSDTLELNCPRN